MKRHKALPMHKAHTNGNDFILLEDLSIDRTSLAQRIAHRKFGIGCDQVIFYNLNSDQTASCTFYNQDGSEAGLCLNGVYALASHLFQKTQKSWKIATEHHQFSMRKTESDNLFLDFGTDIVDAIRPLTLAALQATIAPDTAYCVSVGNHHLVIPTTHVNKYPLSTLAETVAEQNHFPDGINISIFEETKGIITMRTHERGAGLTLGCGSAALSVFMLMHKHKGTKEATIKQPGGTVTLHIDGQRISMHANYQTVASVTLC